MWINNNGYAIDTVLVSDNANKFQKYKDNMAISNDVLYQNKL